MKLLNTHVFHNQVIKIIFVVKKKKKKLNIDKSSSYWSWIGSYTFPPSLLDCVCKWIVGRVEQYGPEPKCMSCEFGTKSLSKFVQLVQCDIREVPCNQMEA